jgi:superfamily I DNA/RNA helicase
VPHHLNHRWPQVWLLIKKCEREGTCFGVSDTQALNGLKKAASELDARLAAALPAGAPRPAVPTFHSACLALLARNAEAAAAHAAVPPGFKVASQARHEDHENHGNYTERNEHHNRVINQYVQGQTKKQVKWAGSFRGRSHVSSLRCQARCASKK